MCGIFATINNNQQTITIEKEFMKVEIEPEFSFKT